MKLRRLASGMSWPLVGFALSLLTPSTWIAHKYLGNPGVFLYIMAASLIIAVGIRYAVPPPTIIGRHLLWLTVATFLGLLLAFAILYPLANAGILGEGSDRDEALNIATTRLLEGEYPYYAETYFGNPISPMPGALLLAMPFVLLGNSAFQSFFWLLVFFVVMSRLLGDGRSALILFWAIFVLSPVALQELVTGGDYLANSLYVLVFAVWTVNAASRLDTAVWMKLLPAILLGIGLSSRANFVLIMPLVFAAMVHTSGWRPAIWHTAVAGTAFAAVTAPFYLYDPGGFSPLHASGMISQFGAVIPAQDIFILAAAGLLALALMPASRGLDAMLAGCAAVLVFPVVCGIALSSVAAGFPTFEFAYYGLPVIVFGGAGFWGMLSRRGSPANGRGAMTEAALPAR